MRSSQAYSTEGLGRVIVLRATNEREATERAAALSTELREDFDNVDGKRVMWRCKSVAGVTPLYVASIADGSEVFSELLPGPRPPDVPA